MLDLLSNPAHVHLWLNHVPTVGFGAALILFVVAGLRKHDVLIQTGLVMFFVVAAVAIATYLSGNAAEPRDAPAADARPPAASARRCRFDEPSALLIGDQLNPTSRCIARDHNPLHQITTLVSDFPIPQPACPATGKLVSDR